MTYESWNGAQAALIASADAQAWIDKGQELSQSLLSLPGVPAAPSAVSSVGVDSAADGLYGGFMLTWPERRPEMQTINYLPDGKFFLSLLDRAYAPVFRRRPHLRSVLFDRSRLEMAFTNDVLQVQLIEGVGRYSMIRHHSLMLFVAALWLNPECRTKWFELCDLVADRAMEGRSSPPSLSELEDIEVDAFDAMERYASQSADCVGARELLKDDVLHSVVHYQTWATAALAALYRESRALSRPDETDWLARQLGEYQSPDFLMDRLSMWS